MRTQKPMPYVAKHARTVPAVELTEAPRANTLSRGARGVVGMALVIGGLGAAAAAPSVFHADSHASAYRQASSVGPAPMSHRPWMY